MCTANDLSDLLGLTTTQHTLVDITHTNEHELLVHTEHILVYTELYLIKRTERKLVLLWEKMNYFLRHTNHTKRLDRVIRTIRTQDLEDGFPGGQNFEGYLSSHKKRCLKPYIPHPETQ